MTRYFFRMARGSGEDWTLCNGELLHQQHPRSFFIPPAERRHNLRFDDFVRLVFLVRGGEPDGPSGERMWLTDIRRGADGRYVGILSNAPAVIRDLGRGDEVEFGPEHVIAVEDPDAIPDSLSAFASRRLIDDDTLIPGYVYHDRSEGERPASREGRRSSGWCLLVGDETDEELNDPANVLLPSLGWLTERYPVFGELVRCAPVGRQFAWDHDQSRYVDIGPYLDPAD